MNAGGPTRTRQDQIWTRSISTPFDTLTSSSWTFAPASSPRQLPTPPPRITQSHGCPPCDSAQPYCLFLRILRRADANNAAKINGILWSKRLSVSATRSSLSARDPRRPAAPRVPVPARQHEHAVSRCGAPATATGTKSRRIVVSETVCLLVKRR